MIINITYIQEELTRKTLKIKPVSSTPKVQYNSNQKQNYDSKHKGQSSEFKEILDSKMQTNKKVLQKRR